MAMVRVLLIVGAVGGVTAWAVAQGAAVPAGVRAGTSSVEAQAPRGTADGTAAVTAVESGFEVAIDRLRTGLGVMPAPAKSGRNPFRFGADRSVGRTSAAQHRATLVQAESTGPGPVAPD